MDKSKKSRSLPLMKSTISVGPVGLLLSPKVCTSCVQPLGLFLSRGSHCPTCGLKVCKKCKVYLVGGGTGNSSDIVTSGGGGTWTCVVCSKDLPSITNKSANNASGSASTSRLLGSGNDKSKKTRDRDAHPSIKRSWSISATNRGSSPVLKAYTKYNGDETHVQNQRGYSSLPRLSSSGQGLSSSSKGGGDMTMLNNNNNNNKHHQPKANAHNSSTSLFSASNHHRRKTKSVQYFEEFLQPLPHGHFPFISTLHPYLTTKRPSPSSSINFIEDEYWDYYDYNYDQHPSSTRSSTERSLGEVVEIHPSGTTTIFVPTPPLKPLRRKRGRSKSFGSYDNMISNPKLSCPPHPMNDYDHSVANANSAIYDTGSLPIPTKRRSNSLGKENIRKWAASGIRLDHYLTPPSLSHEMDSRRFPPSHNLHQSASTVHSFSLPRRLGQRDNTSSKLGSDHQHQVKYSTPTWSNPRSYSTLPKEWKIVKRHNSNSTTILISEVNPIPLELTPMVPSPKLPRPHPVQKERVSIQPSFSGRRIRNPRDSEFLRKYPACPKEAYPLFPSALSPIASSGSGFHHNWRKQPKSLLPLVDDDGREWNNCGRLFDLPNSRISKSEDLALSFVSGHNNRPSLSCQREVIIQIEREEGIDKQKNCHHDPHKMRKVVTSTINPKVDLIPHSPLISSVPEIRPEEQLDHFRHQDYQNPNNGMEELLHDPIETSDNESESSFHSFDFVNGDHQNPRRRNPLQYIDNNGPYSSMVIPVDMSGGGTRGEDKDEFVSCHNDDDHDDDEDEEDYQDFHLLPFQSSSPSFSIPNRPQNHLAHQILTTGLSDQHQHETDTSTIPRVPTPVTTSTLSPLYVVEPHCDNGTDQNESTTDTKSEISESSTMTATSQLTSAQFPKYKSRVLIGSNIDQAYEISGDEVEIVIGRSGSTASILIPTPNVDDEEEKRNTLHEPPPIPPVRPRVARYRRESPEGEEAVKEASPQLSFNDEDDLFKNQITDLETPSRSSPDGADAEKTVVIPASIGDEASTPILELHSGDEEECGSESTDSWTEEVSRCDFKLTSPVEGSPGASEDRPAPLDMTLHTICEESETESETNRITPIPPPIPKTSAPRNADSRAAATSQVLEQYFKYAGVEESSDVNAYEESEFSDTLSESSLIEFYQSGIDDDEAVDLAAGRLEKYFLNLGVPFQHHPDPTVVENSRQEPDSAGSESESVESNGGDRKKKVRKHFRRSAEYEDELAAGLSEDDDTVFEQDGYDTIKKSRSKLKKSDATTNAISESKSQSMETKTVASPKNDDRAIPVQSDLIPASAESQLKQSLKGVSRSNSFNWSSDEEVNLMMRSLRQLIRNMTHQKQLGSSPKSPSRLPPLVSDEKGQNLTYLESELLRLMNKEPNMAVEEITDLPGDTDLASSPVVREDVYNRLFGHGEVPTEPELLGKVMTHIGQRLSTWMKDPIPAETTATIVEEDKDETATIKPSQSISSDLNDEAESDSRFSWKGSFESALAKRQSVGSSDSLLDYYGGSGGGSGSGAMHMDHRSMSDLFPDRSILRSNSLHHLAHSQQPILEETESLTSTSSLTRLPQLTTSSSSSSSSGKESNRRDTIHSETFHPVGNKITKSKSLFLDSSLGGQSQGRREVRSARYRPPGYFEGGGTQQETHASTPVLSHRERKKMEADLKDLSPSGYKVSNPRGFIEFSMEYNYKTTTFEVAVKQCRDLAPVDLKKGRSDPYVKGYLLPDRTKSNKRKTKTKKNTLNPVFGETLKFSITLEDLENRILWLSVWHSDIFGKNEFLGQVSLPLRGLTFDDPSGVWWPLKDNKTHSTGTKDLSLTIPSAINLVVALKWIRRDFQNSHRTGNISSGTLSVLIKEAKGLKLIKSSLPSTFIKCSPLSDRSKKQKTSLSRRTLNPIWNSTLTFEGVIIEEGLELSLYNSDLLNHEQLATVTLDSNTSDIWMNMGRREGFWVEGLVQLSPITTANLGPSTPTNYN